MSTAEIQTNIRALQEIPVGLCHAHPANKVRPLTEEFQASIRDVGQKQAALLRPHPELPGEFEIVYGARRQMALQELGMPFLLALVREMSDEEARLERAIENEHREPLSWWQKAEMIMECIVSGSKPETIGEALGCSAYQVRRTGHLLNLSVSWRVLLDSREMAKWGGGHFEPFAYLPEEAQEDLYAEFPQGQAGDWSAKDVEKWVAERATLLKVAPWDLESETLVAAAGSCVACPERSSAKPDLFGAVTGPKAQDRCLNCACYGRKMEAWLDLQYAKAVKKHGRVVKITKEYDVRGDELAPGQYTEAKKADDGAVAAFVVRGTGMGKVEWVTLPGTRKGKKATDEVAKAFERADRNADTAEEPKRGPGRPTETDEVKRAKHEARRWAMAVDMLMEAIDLDQYPVVFPTTQVVAMAVAFGVQSTANNGEPWQALDKMRGWEKLDLRAALLAQVKKAVVIRLLSSEDKVAEGKRAAELFQIDLDAFKAEADKEIADPAAWGKSVEADDEDTAQTNGQAWANIEPPPPDLLFNNPQKQKAYLFLKVYPDQDYEAYLVSTGDMTVTRAQYWQVQDAIEAQAERLKKAVKA